MSSKGAQQHARIMMQEVWEAVAAIEKEHHVHVHFVFRRDPSIRRLGFGRLICFARRLGLGDEATTASKEEISYPTSDGASFEAVLFQLAVYTSNRLDEQAAVEKAKQERFFPPEAD